ncbi:MAG: DUF4861 domain-containing protein [Cyclobacteriaceae bacterium]|nr:DUF4861 domain-containing protein [Cyclobacteriaceae bacterium]
MKTQIKIASFCLLWMAALSCSQQKESEAPQLVLTDPSPAKGEKGWVISRLELSQLTEIPNGHLPYVADENGKALPSQTDDIDGDGTWDELAALISFDQDSHKSIYIHFATPDAYPNFPRRSNIRFALKENGTYNELTQHVLPDDHTKASPSMDYQMEGPAWENDLIGYRMYFDPRNGYDIFGKISTDMVMDKVGINEDYHKMQSWGMDVLKVGNSLGAGAIALYHNENYVRLGKVDKQSYRFITEGPVRAIFDLQYEGWDIGDEKIDLVRRIEIWAGSYAYNSYVTLRGEKEKYALVTGIVNMKSDQMTHSAWDNGWQAISTFDYQTENPDGEELLGMAVLYRDQEYIEHGELPDKGADIVETYYVTLQATPGVPVLFAFASGWEVQSEQFKSNEGFLEMLKNEGNKLVRPSL